MRISTIGLLIISSSSLVYSQECKESLPLFIFNKINLKNIETYNVPNEEMFYLNLEYVNGYFYISEVIGNPSEYYITELFKALSKFECEHDFTFEVIFAFVKSDYIHWRKVLNSNLYPTSFQKLNKLTDDVKFLKIERIKSKY